MTDIEDLRSRASAAREAQRFDESLTLYEELWKNNRSACNKWDGWGYAYSLRKQGRLQEALDVSRELFRQHRDLNTIRNLYAWCIYDLHLKIEKVEDVQEFERAANAIMTLCQRDDQYSPYVRTVFRILDQLKANCSPERILEWTEKLNPGALSMETRTFTDSRGKTVEIASDKEKWFGIRTKALERAGRFSECREVCERALKEIPALHYDNEIWFKRRIALAKAHTGERTEAVEELKMLLRRRREWFLCGDIARLLAEMGDNETAIGYAIDALLLPGDLEKKCRVVLTLAELHESVGDLNLARRHTCLATAIREEQGWKSTRQLDEIVARLGVGNNGNETASTIRKSLVSGWRAHKESKQPRHRGTVKTLLSNGRAGFIRADDGQEYYFPLRAFRGRRQEVVPRVRVSFVLEESFDRKKKRASLQAAEIQIIRES